VVEVVAAMVVQSVEELVVMELVASVAAVDQVAAMDPDPVAMVVPTDLEPAVAVLVAVVVLTAVEPAVVVGVGL
jgi:hypothetical protein